MNDPKKERKEYMKVCQEEGHTAEQCKKLWRIYASKKGMLKFKG